MDFSGVEKPNLNLNLEKLSDGLQLDLKKSFGRPVKRVLFGLAWQPVLNGPSLDLDVCAIAEHRSNHGPQTLDDIMFYKTAPDASCWRYAEYSGDDRDGSGQDGDDDDEFFKFDLTKVPADIEAIRLLVTIYDAKARQQTLGTGESRVKIYDTDDNRLIKEYSLNGSDELQLAIGVDLGKFKRDGNGWVFKGTGTPLYGDLNDVVGAY